MNRVKLWVYVILAVSAGAFFLRSSSIDAIERARGALDHRLRAAAAYAESAVRGREEKVAGVAAIAGRDLRLLEAMTVAAVPLTPPKGKRPPVPAPPDEARRETDRLGAARTAARDAAKTLGLDPKTRLEVWVAGEGDFADGAKGDGAVMELLRGAAAGQYRTARVMIDSTVFLVASAPAGAGGAVAVALPLDAAWTAAVTSATGAEVTVVAPGAKVLTTATEAEAKLVSGAAAKAPKLVAEVGQLAPVPLGLALPVKVPAVPVLFAKAPSHLALGLPLASLKGAQVVVSVETATALAPLVREQWMALGGLAALLLLGLLFGLLVQGAVPAQVPSELVAAASRIERGDFGARAPTLAGKLGTVAAALNAAAAAAERPAAAPEPMFPAPPAPAEAEPSAFAFPVRPPAAAAADPFAPASSPGPSALSGAAFEAAPVRAPEAAPAPFDPASLAPPLSTPAELLQGAALSAAPEPAAEARGNEDEDHWKQVFEDFVRVRRECGEPADGLGFDRFRGKLEKNRDQLVQKYGCKTVRFQVYVKDGKAALKATPVR